jgi:enterochelin esterase-like enzyme
MTAASSPVAEAQGRGAGNALRSTEVLPDGRVTFRIRALKATAVSVTGEWVPQGLGTAGQLTNDGQGVWSVTLGPLPADFYSYTFTVDGVKTIDPGNALIKQGLNSLDSVFLLPGKEAAFEEAQPVPHGNIQIVWYKSSTLGMERRLHIYTPPGYDSSSGRMPVLYLLHGAGDEDSGWSTFGRAGFILDNLIAQAKAKPMIVVMPNGSQPRGATPAGGRGSTNAPAGMGGTQAWFTSELLDDIVPFVEKNYRVQATPAGRAIAGLSMGGGQTLGVITSHPDQFTYIGLWSAAVGGGRGGGLEERYATFLAGAAKFNEQLKCLSISVGEKDSLAAGSKELAAVFEKHGIKNELHISAGGHTWINWRHYLNDFAPRLFQ